MDNGALYSKNKILKHTSTLDKIKAGKNTSPILARIDVTNACNHRCVYCMYQKSLPEFGLCDSFNFKDSIPAEDLIKLISQLRKWGVKAIMFAGGGEPTIYPEFKKAVAFSLKEGFEVGIITNGANLDRTWIKLMKHKNLKWIRISLDASNQKTWGKIHRPTSGNTFKDIIRLVKRFKEGKIKTQLGASFVINDLNWQEIVSFVKLCKKNMFNDVRISFTYQIKREKLYTLHKDAILLSLNEAKKLTEEKFYVNILKERLESIEKNKKRYNRCYFPYFSLSIGANLKLYPCCMTKYAKKYALADLKDQALDLRFTKRWAKFIKNIDPKKCPSCWYNHFNEMCNYYSEKTEFENFIN